MRLDGTMFLDRGPDGRVQAAAKDVAMRFPERSLVKRTCCRFRRTDPSFRTCHDTEPPSRVSPAPSSRRRVAPGIPPTSESSPVCAVPAPHDMQLLPGNDRGASLRIRPPSSAGADPGALQRKSAVLCDPRGSLNGNKLKVTVAASPKPQDEAPSARCLLPCRVRSSVSWRDPVSLPSIRIMSSLICLLGDCSSPCRKFGCGTALENSGECWSSLLLSSCCGSFFVSYCRCF
jgi:hypothetical protein